MSNFFKRTLFGIDSSFYVRSVVMGAILAIGMIWMTESALADADFAASLHNVILFRLKFYAGIGLITLLYPYSRYVQHRVWMPSSADSYCSGLESTSTFWFGADLLQVAVGLIYRGFFWSMTPLVAPIGMLMIACEPQRRQFAFA